MIGISLVAVQDFSSALFSGRSGLVQYAPAIFMGWSSCLLLFLLPPRHHRHVLVLRFA